jgi:hypothetical protein
MGERVGESSNGSELTETLNPDMENTVIKSNTPTNLWSGTSR